MIQHFLLSYFKYDHLPEHLKVISKPFCELAERMVNTIPEGYMLDTCLQKLLEAKDCAVRAAL